MRDPRTWDIFCRVVDNVGDAGVCWRLARELAAEHGAAVRLWIDDLSSLQRLQPAVVETGEQTIDGVDVRRWPEAFANATVPDVVIEAFGCGLPDDYAAALAGAASGPLWIVLEYLSAEPWVPAHHGLPSPHPRLLLERYYFFPGFVRGSGGLLREADLFARRDAFDDARRNALWRSFGFEPPANGATTVSLFAYDTAPLGELLRAWENGATQIVAAVPEGRLLDAVGRIFGVQRLATGAALRSGRLEVRAVPFLPQARYDELLWTCDCNFVRGEDSFVRAQWAARPFVWQIYPQQERAHWGKLEAFLSIYGEGLPADVRAAASAFMRAWNQVDGAGVTTASAWPAYLDVRGPLREHGAAWAGRIAGIGDLAGNLVRFCRQRLKTS